MPGKCTALGRASLAGALLFFAGWGLAQPAAPAAATKCVACHGPQGNSVIPSIPSLAGQPKVFLENHLVLIREGMRDIAAMKGQLDGLSDKDLGALADYFSAQTPTAPRGTPKPDMFERGQLIAKNMLCASCHESNYAGRQQMPRLAAQHETYLRDTMKQFRDHPAAGRDTVMSAALHGLKDADLADLAHYLAHLK